MTFGKRLKKARTEKNMTQKQLADLLSVKHNSISNWENDVNKPDPDTIELICGILEITPNFLLATSTEDFSPAEKLIIKKYRELDEHGRKMFNFMLQEEWERSTQPMEGQIMIYNDEDDGLGIVKNGGIVPYEAVGTPALKASRNNHENEPGEQKKMQEDMELLKRPD